VSIAGLKELSKNSVLHHHQGALLSEKPTTTRTCQQLGHTPVDAPSALREGLEAFSKSGTKALPYRAVGKPDGLTLLFTVTSVNAAPRIGLGIAAVLTWAAGVVSTLRSRAIASNELGDVMPNHAAG
jgi:hypothetical protein